MMKVTCVTIIIRIYPDLFVAVRQTTEGIERQGRGDERDA